MRHISLFSENHNGVGLPDAYADTCARMHASGTNIWLLENTPGNQASLDLRIDKVRQDLAQGRVEFGPKILRLKSDYALLDAAQGAERHSVLRDSVLLLAANYGKQMLCCDVADRSAVFFDAVAAGYNTLPRFTPNRLQTAFDDIDFSTLADNAGLNPRDAELLAAKVQASIINDTFRQEHDAAFVLRGTTDCRISDYIVDKVPDDQSAFGFFGQKHTDLNRPDSLASCLLRRDDVILSIYEIDQDTGLMRSQFNPGRNFTRQTTRPTRHP